VQSLFWPVPSAATAIVDSPAAAAVLVDSPAAAADRTSIACMPTGAAAAVLVDSPAAAADCTPIDFLPRGAADTVFGLSIRNPKPAPAPPAFETLDPKPASPVLKFAAFLKLSLPFSSSRGLHSYTFQLNVSAFCEIRWVPSVYMWDITRSKLNIKRLTGQNGFS